MAVTLNSMMRNYYNTYKMIQKHGSANGSNQALSMLDSMNSASSNAGSLNGLMNPVNGRSGAVSNTDLYDIAKDYGTYKANQRSIHRYFRSQYGSGSAARTSSTSRTPSAASAAGDAEKNMSKVGKAASELMKSANKLTATGDGSVFRKDESGEYDKEGITSAVSSFVDNYNALKTTVVKEGNTKEVGAELELVNNTRVFSKALGRVGITVNSDNSLSLDKDALKSANMDTVKALFNGKTSYANSVSEEAKQVKDTSSASSSFSFSGFSGTGRAGGSFINMLV